VRATYRPACDYFEQNGIEGFRALVFQDGQGPLGIAGGPAGVSAVLYTAAHERTSAHRHSGWPRSIRQTH
jgi:hypothetical protein